MLKKIKEKYKQIFIRQEKKIGNSKTLNQAIESCTGEL